MGNINARGGKMGFGKKTKPVSVGDVWGGIVSKEKEEMEFRGAKELDKVSEGGWGDVEGGGEERCWSSDGNIPYIF